MSKKLLRKKILFYRKNNYNNLTLKYSLLKNIFKKLNLARNIKIGGYIPINYEIDSLIILKQLEKSGYKIGEDVCICLDVAANELCKDNKYAVSSSKFISADKTIDYYQDLVKKYPIKSIEDPLSEDDWNSWSNLTKSLDAEIQIVGDDLFVTNKERLLKGIEAKAANTILIKPNQIGTLTETLEVIKLALSLIHI